FARPHDLTSLSSPPTFYRVPPILLSFFFYCSCPLRDLHSFPTRRSSDLPPGAGGGAVVSPRARRARPVSHDRVHGLRRPYPVDPDRKSTRLNSSHGSISYAVFCLKKKKKK